MFRLYPATPLLLLLLLLSLFLLLPTGIPLMLSPMRHGFNALDRGSFAHVVFVQDARGFKDAWISGAAVSIESMPR